MLNVHCFFKTVADPRFWGYDRFALLPPVGFCLYLRLRLMTNRNIAKKWFGDPP